jgi:hypothetical protein
MLTPKGTKVLQNLPTYPLTTTTVQHCLHETSLTTHSHHTIEQDKAGKTCGSLDLTRGFTLCAGRVHNGCTELLTN